MLKFVMCILGKPGAFGFFYKNVSNIKREIIEAFSFRVSLMVSLIFSLALLLPDAFPAKQIDLVNVLIGYCSIAMGFCVAGVTMSLTFSDSDFAKKLISQSSPKGINKFSKLIFVFTWTAFLHWVAIVVLVLVMLSSCENSTLSSTANSYIKSVISWPVSFVVIYSFMQFLITIITLMQVADVYVRETQKISAFHIRKSQNASTK